MRGQELRRNIDKLNNDYRSNVKKYMSKKNKESMTTIRCQIDKAKEYCNDEMQLSKQTYELVC